MSYWKTKVLPKIKRYFEKPGKKRAAAEASKSFESSKESIEKALEEKQEELRPKVTEIYKTSDEETKTLIKQPTDAGIKKHPKSVQTLLDELVKIDFPGAAQVSEASVKYGPALLLGPVTFILQKTFTFITEESEVPPPTESRDVALETAVETKEATEAKTSDVTTVVEERKTGSDVVTEKVEKSEEKVEVVEETPTDDGKTVVTVPAPETVSVSEAPKP